VWLQFADEQPVLLSLVVKESSAVKFLAGKHNDSPVEKQLANVRILARKFNTHHSILSRVKHNTIPQPFSVINGDESWV